MHKAILLVVEAHVRVGDIAPSLVVRVLEALVEGITDIALYSFQQIPKFGTGGMLTVSLYGGMADPRQRSRSSFCTSR
jgi:exocyst complex component 2